MEEWESCEGTMARPHRLIQVKLTGRMINMDIADSCPLCDALWENHIQADFAQYCIYVRIPFWRSLTYGCCALLILLTVNMLWRC